jgi:S-adenosylmethionine uptake transporter
MLRGILLGFLSYAVFSFGDASVKALGGRLPVFEITFFATLFALIALPFVREPGEGWTDMFRMRRPGLVLLRAASGTTAGLLGVVAFTTLPFAEAYAIIFLTPLFVTLLSVLFLGEQVGWRRSAAVAAGFIGVLLVVRPGFREVLPGHFAAVAVAAAAATTVILLRALAQTERRSTLLGIVLPVALTVNGTLMLTDFRVPQPADFVWLVLAGVLAGVGQILLMAATRAAPANRIAPAQYSQIIWAVLIGAIFFGEFPDGPALIGIAIVVVSGMVTLARTRQKGSIR